MNSSEKSALDTYLGEPPVDMKVFMCLNVLSHRKDDSHCFEGIGYYGF